MKKVWKLLMLPLALSFVSCHPYRYDDDNYAFPCERDRVGTVCFDNDTRKVIKMEIGDTKTEIEGYTTLCVDVYEGDREFKGKQGTKWWKGVVSVYRCEQSFVELDR